MPRTDGVPPRTRSKPPATTRAMVHRLFLDLQDDGLDLTRCDRASRRRAAAATKDDRLLVVDTVAAAAAGYKLESVVGATARFMPFGTGLRLSRPDGTRVEPSNGWALLALVDGNRDGILDRNDLIWTSLALARDRSDVVDASDIETLAGAGVVTLGPRTSPASERDPLGNELTHGEFSLASHTRGRMSDVALASCDPS
jgi:hypothetical protein